MALAKWLGGGGESWPHPHEPPPLLSPWLLLVARELSKLWFSFPEVEALGDALSQKTFSLAAFARRLSWGHLVQGPAELSLARGFWRSGGDRQPCPGSAGLVTLGSLQSSGHQLFHQLPNAEFRKGSGQGAWAVQGWHQHLVAACVHGSAGWGWARTEYLRGTEKKILISWKPI